MNARGTLNVLEAIRAQASPPPLLFTSTNKVYGALEDVGDSTDRNLRYEPTDASLRQSGVSESRPLDFHSPYGCSKGTADQYVLDYARSYGLPAIVFRMSCIYGAHQFGTEDQGWVAHFLIRALEGHPITLYGDGRQVRDILSVEDLVDAFLLAQEYMASESGQAFNMGGGPRNTISLLVEPGILDLDCRAPGACTGGRVRRMADGRPALLHLGYRKIPARHRMEAADLGSGRSRATAPLVAGDKAGSSGDCLHRRRRTDSKGGRC